MAERMVYYKTAAKYGEVEQTIEKSRFIGYIKPVQNREEAEAFIAEIRALHRSATHNVPAYVIGEKSEMQWASDDKEPSGTAGAPILHLLNGEGITNVAVVVTWRGLTAEQPVWLWMRRESLKSKKWIF